MKELVENVPARVGIGDDPQSLALIHSCTAAIWRRCPVERFQSWIDELDPIKLPSARIILPVNRVRETLLQLCEVSGTPNCAERAMLVDDAAALANMFCDVMSAPFLQLQLGVVADNACQDFHISSDDVKARLVCMYRGTEMHVAMSTGGTNFRQVYTVPTGSPVLLRGARWQRSATPVLYHRPMPVEGMGKTRLVLVLDTVDEPEDCAD